MTNSKTVKITTRNVGQNFGTEGVIKARNGRTLETTDTYPLGFTTAAREAAEKLAAKRGWTVVA